MDPTTDLLPLRDRLRMTQQAFADAFGLTLGAVKDWETGRRKPDSAALAYLRTIAAEPETVRRIQAEATTARGTGSRGKPVGAPKPRLRERMLIPDTMWDMPTEEIGRALRGAAAPKPSPPRLAANGHTQAHVRLIAVLKARAAQGGGATARMVTNGNVGGARAASSKAPPVTPPVFRKVQAAPPVRREPEAGSLAPAPVRVRVPIIPAEPTKPPFQPAYTPRHDDPGIVAARRAGALAGVRMAMLRERASDGGDRR